MLSYNVSMRRNKLFLSLILLACVSGANAKEYYGKPWINSNIKGNIPNKPPRLQDNFELAVNYDSYKKVKIPKSLFSVNSFSLLDLERQDELISVLEEETYSSHEQQLCQTVYKQALDFKKRKELGIKPALYHFAKIKKTNSIEQFKQLLLEDFLVSPGLYGIELSMIDFKDSNSYLPCIYNDMSILPDADLYKEPLSEEASRRLAINMKYFEKAFVRFGFSKKEAKELLAKAYAVEKILAQKAYGTEAYSQLDFNEKSYNVFSIEEAEKKYPNLQIKKVLQSLNVGFLKKIWIYNPDAMEIANSLMTEENFEGIKALSMLNYLKYCYDKLDYDYYKIFMDRTNETYGSNNKYSDKQIAFFTLDDLQEPLGKAWSAKYCSQAIKDDVTNIIYMYVDAFKLRINNLSWMSAETKKKAVEKLEAMKLNVCYPDKWHDYSNLKLPENPDDGNLFESIELIKKFQLEQAVQNISKPVDKELWGDGIYPQTVNAFYNFQQNSINIIGGYLGGDFYDYNWPIEKKLAGIGCTIGHELTHGFDATGSQFDKVGNLNNWWQENDKKLFDELNQKVIDYYSQIEVYPGIFNNGLLCIGETVSDFGGIQLSLDISKQFENFNYDDFFKQTVIAWFNKSSKDVVLNQAQFDAHPLSYIRANFVNQFQEFYDVYDVKPGDGMWIDEDKRLSVW